MKGWKIAVAAALAVGAGAAGSSLVYGGSDTDGAPNGGLADRAPVAQGQSLDAKTATKHGTFGVLLYRNKGGQQCMAAGRVNGTTVAAARTPSMALPLEQVGVCDLRTTPAAVSIIHTREETTIYGLAADDVTSVAVRSGDVTLTGRPAADHAFILNTPTSLEGPVDLTATSKDGKRQNMRVANLPSWDEINNATPPPSEGHEETP